MDKLEWTAAPKPKAGKPKGRMFKVILEAGTAEETLASVFRTLCADDWVTRSTSHAVVVSESFPPITLDQYKTPVLLIRAHNGQIGFSRLHTVLGSCKVPYASVLKANLPTASRFDGPWKIWSSVAIEQSARRGFPSFVNAAYAPKPMGNKKRKAGAGLSRNGTGENVNTLTQTLRRQAMLEAKTRDSAGSTGGGSKDPLPGASASVPKQQRQRCKGAEVRASLQELVPPNIAVFQQKISEVARSVVTSCLSNDDPPTFASAKNTNTDYGISADRSEVCTGSAVRAVMHRQYVRRKVRENRSQGKGSRRRE
eukprot:g2653.t1